MRNTRTQTEDARNNRRHRRLLRRVSVGVVCVVSALTLGLAALTWFLSPERLTGIFNERASSYFYADVHARRVNYTLWSTFPHLCLQIDSLRIVSRTLPKNAAARMQLPHNADSLASLRHLRGSINVMSLLAGRYELGHVQVYGMKLNMVTLNDSVNNFSIIPATPDVKFKVPYISADYVDLRDLQDITFRSVPAHLNARASLNRASLRRAGKGTNDYMLTLVGSMNADFDRLKVCRNLPFKFVGDLSFGFDPFSLAMKDMNVNMANMQGNVSMGMNIGDTSRLDDFRTEISTADLMKLLDYLPSKFLPDLSGLHANLRTGISVRLSKPYDFASGVLPSLTATLTVPQSRVNYTLRNGQSYNVDRLSLLATLSLDGDHPERSRCDINRLEASGEGLALLAVGRINNVFSHPVLDCSAHISASLPQVSVLAHQLHELHPRGNMDLQARATIPLSDVENLDITSIPLSGTGSVRGLRISLPDGGDVRARNTSFSLSHALGEPFTLLAEASDVFARSQGVSVSVPRLCVSGDALTPQNIALCAEIPGISLSAAGVTAYASGVRVAAEHLADAPRVAASLAEVQLSSKGETPFSLSAAQVSASRAADGCVKTMVRRADVSIGEGHLLSGSQISAVTRTFSDWKVTASRLAYVMPPTDEESPLSVVAREVDGRLALVESELDGITLSIASCDCNTDYYPEPVQLLGLHASCSHGYDCVHLDHVELRSQLTAMTMAGDMLLERRAGLPPMIHLNANLDIDTLHFNQIAHGLEHGVMARHPELDRPSVSPVSTFTTPENLDLHLHATAMATVYTNLWLRDLAADLTMRPGMLSLDTLSLDANFGHAGAAMCYDCVDTDHLKMSMKGNIYDFHLTEFFRSYPKVLAMMPEMANLHGVFRANAEASAEVFPSMVVNNGSIVAHVQADAKDMYLHQTPFIRKLAHMALIFEREDIDIPAIHAEARVFDNMLTLYPVDIVISKYHLRALGRNDFSGNLFYHVAVLHNPLLPLHFGINIDGKYHHPHLKLSRARYSEEDAAKVNHIDVPNRLNLVHEARKMGVMLVHHAAKAPILTYDPTYSAK